jgi:hypothetical protein
MARLDDLNCLETRIPCQASDHQHDLLYCLLSSTNGEEERPPRQQPPDGQRSVTQSADILFNHILVMAHAYPYNTYINQHY